MHHRSHRKDDGLGTEHLKPNHFPTIPPGKESVQSRERAAAAPTLVWIYCLLGFGSSYIQMHPGNLNYLL